MKSNNLHTIYISICLNVNNAADDKRITMTASLFNSLANMFYKGIFAGAVQKGLRWDSF